MSREVINVTAARALALKAHQLVEEGLRADREKEAVLAALEEEILDWDATMDLPPARQSGVITVTLVKQEKDNA